MSLLSLIAALMLEQVRPLPESVWSGGLFSRYAALIERNFNAGEKRHGMIAWLVAVLPPVLLVAVVFYFLLFISPLLALLFNVAMLYLTMGFRQVSHYFSAIPLALRGGDLDTARALIGRWRGRSADRLNSSEVARLAIEEGLVASHRHVFGVVVWFLVLPGASGALFYRLTQLLAREWAQHSDQEYSRFGDFAGRAFEIIDWMPIRITATAFAIVGDFEDAIYCWRTQAAKWLHPGLGILLASGAGALGVRLGMPIHEYGELADRPELGVGDEADADFMQSTIGLVWRTLVLCLLLLALLWVASWVGR
jgi:adenosylcobinamide-phosphate synthase